MWEESYVVLLNMMVQNIFICLFSLIVNCVLGNCIFVSNQKSDLYIHLYKYDTMINILVYNNPIS